MAGAQEPKQEAVIQQITLRGTVDAVDHTARIVRVKTDQGNIVTLDVPASYTRFDQVKVGDVVTITYYDRVSVRLKPAGKPPQIAPMTRPRRLRRACSPAGRE